MPETNETYQPLTFDAIKIGLASPEKILEWSHGEVKKPETINYRTLKPERDGLFCERIFGPSKDWECHCGKYKKIRYKGVICDRCGVEVTKSSVRRERIGHIQLAAPVSHIWYFKGIPSRMGLILDISPRVLEKVLYFASYIVLDAGQTGLQYKQVLSEKEYREEVEKWGYGNFRVGMGAEAVLELLKSIDLEKESEMLKRELKESSGQKRARIIKRLEVVEAFRNSGNKPEWMIMTVIPVIPPDIRPMVQLDGGRFATSDLNDLYRRIINRNNRLARLLELGAPDIIVRNEKRMLQEAVDALIDNGRRGRPVTGPGNRALKSLSDMLKGKQGRFRQNLLGKRVDYSGRSVIVVGPELKIYQCGLPKEMAIELFKPFVMKELVQNGTAHNIKSAKKMVERLQSEVWDVLEDVIKEHPVMLNRAPTLHRLGIQAFEPILVEGKAIKLHPLVCTAFNADFDGDQMAVHLPLSQEAQAECRFLLLSPNNLLKPSDGGPVAVPSQDMVLGIYYLTQERPGAVGEGMIFKSVNEAILAYENAAVTLHSRIKVRVTKTMPDGTEKTGVVESTLGRFIFNEIIPQDLGFVDRSVPGNELVLEVDFHVGKKQLKKILEKVINVHGATQTAVTLDDIKAIGYKYSTRAAMTVSIADMTVPASKPQLLADAQATVDRIAKNFRRGLITEEERYKEVIDTWKTTDDQLTKDLLGGLDKYNNIFMMADSGARGSDKQIKQLAGMRGLMADTTGHTIELPIKSNFREGLDVLEYFISAHGARKGMSDTALRTADSGYLTRRLVDVSQDLIVREVDCCEGKDIPYMEIKAFTDGKETIESLEERITGRYIAETITDPETGEVVVKANHMCTPKRAAAVMKALNKMGRDSVKIRTVLSCKSHIGVCAKCYGANMAVPASKPQLLADAQATVDRIAKNFRRGLITEEERYKEVIDTWKTTDDQLTKDLLGGLDKYNNIFMMADSGARGSDKQIKQLAGMRGLMADTTGHTIELPIKSNFREGLDVLEYFISAHGARKGMSDTALRTADSGYLTRRLVDVSQDLIVREVDCCEGKDIPYMEIKAFTDGKETIESLEERITGRYIAETITDPETGEVVVKANHMCTPKRAAAVMKALNKMGRDSVKIRTVLSCKSHIGVCAKCYGANMATGQPVQVGEAVGIIAAQSIGEPGTQLTMRTFHTGGVAGGDITQGLPRVEELFEARKPKGLAIITEFGGVVTLKDTKKKREIVVTDPETGNSKTYLIPYGSRIKVQDEQVIEAGDELTEGSVNPHDILKIKGVRAVQDYMIQEVQRVYRLQGVEINDKHVEMIVRQMLKKIRIEESGDSDVLPGVSMDVLDFNEMNEALIAEGKQPAEGKQVMLGITKASLATDSFLSAASFQETTKVLTEAAINGKVDHLIGLKENVIIGKLIPAGTGMKRYRSVKLNTDVEPQDEIALEDDDEILLSGDNEEDDDMADEAPEVFDIDDSEE